MCLCAHKVLTIEDHLRSFHSNSWPSRRSRRPHNTAPPLADCNRFYSRVEPGPPYVHSHRLQAALLYNVVHVYDMTAFRNFRGIRARGWEGNGKIGPVCVCTYDFDLRINRLNLYTFSHSAVHTYRYTCIQTRGLTYLASMSNDHQRRSRILEE